MTHPTNPSALKVKRDGPRGWHWISAESFDPTVHELVEGEEPVVEAPPAPEADPAATPAPKPRQPRKRGG